jgi:hypothetical protein
MMTKSDRQWSADWLGLAWANDGPRSDDPGDNCRRVCVWSRAFVVNSGDSPTSTAIRVIAQPQSWQANRGDKIALSVEATSTNRCITDGNGTGTTFLKRTTQP